MSFRRECRGCLQPVPASQVGIEAGRILLCRRCLAGPTRCLWCRADLPDDLDVAAAHHPCRAYLAIRASGMRLNLLRGGLP